MNGIELILEIITNSFIEFQMRCPLPPIWPLSPWIQPWILEETSQLNWTHLHSNHAADLSNVIHSGGDELGEWNFTILHSFFLLFIHFFTFCTRIATSRIHIDWRNETEQNCWSKAPLIDFKLTNTLITVDRLSLHLHQHHHHHPVYFLSLITHCLSKYNSILYFQQFVSTFDQLEN